MSRQEENVHDYVYLSRIFLVDQRNTIQTTIGVSSVGMIGEHNQRRLDMEQGKSKHSFDQLNAMDLLKTFYFFFSKVSNN